MITEKQLNCIKFISNNTNAKFEGNTKTDASKFIGENLENAQNRATARASNKRSGESESSQSYKKEWRDRVNYSNCGFNVNCKDNMNSYGW